MPHHPQQPFHCGPAALATVLHVSGDPAEPEGLVPELLSPQRRGTLQLSVVAAVRRHGRIAYPIRDLTALLREIAAGHPVLVLQNLGIRWIPFWHYAVVVGYDLERRTVVLRSGEHRRRVLSLTVFERTWRRSGYWGLVVLSPERLPATVERETLLAELAALETAGASGPAARGYRAALERWPDSVVAWLGLGNSAYASQDLESAEEAFRSAIRIAPAAPDAHNNLAHVLLERGRHTEALSAAREAVRLGGPRVDLYRETLDAIRSTAPEAAP